MLNSNKEVTEIQEFFYKPDGFVVNIYKSFDRLDKLHSYADITYEDDILTALELDIVNPKPLPYGAANIEPPNTIGDHEKITWLATTFLEHKESIEQSGIEDLHFYIGYFYENQCNLALTASELKLIAETGLDYWFSCYGAK
jgi:hypothetical protein